MDKVSRSVSVVDVFIAFLKLGLTSFGGPIAHVGYFRTEFVERREWVTDEEFAQLLATSQFLPGPASSQLGFSIGLSKAGWFGALAAFIAFTAPSVILLVAFASVLPFLSGEIGQAVIHGLKLVACIIVVDAVISMAKALCRDWSSRVIAMLSLIALLLITSIYAQMLVIGTAAILGAVAMKQPANQVATRPVSVRYGIRLGSLLLLVFTLLLIALPWFASQQPDYVSVADAFYRAGALVFGGGHVVLPLLEGAVVQTGWVGEGEFLAGYGAAQAIPGPMFAFSAYLGSLIEGHGNQLMMVTLTTVSMFLPGFLLMAGILPFWRHIASNSIASGMIKSVNAAVVGLLAAAFYDPIVSSAISGYYDIGVALIGFLILFKWRVSPVLIVLLCILATVGRVLIL